ncbi:hypothetical protein WJX73_003346 [Symbiochloris irregularis]|uniref:Pre-mRNA-splicing factor 18 n=1 Tax=Symbiochloris irregularis TaxID=706552 RepID=A0AAW1P2U8_9CHLO
MPGLQDLLAAKRKAVEQTYGSRKSAKTSTLEAAQLQQVREQEKLETAKKAAVKQQGETATADKEVTSPRALKRQDSLPAVEVIRRLRLLGEPATLFGETEADRATRLQRAQEDLQLDDEHATGGQQANELLDIVRQRKRGKKENAAPEAPQADQPVEEEDEDPTAAAFKAAAQVLKRQQEEQKMSIDQRITKYLQQWCEEWRQDLERRPAEAKRSGAGHQTTLLFEQTMGFFKPLYRQLKNDSVPPEMKAGLWMIIEAALQRNYLSAYDIYMHLAIGNNPWPIGVTSVGIHERSAREKISHTMNAAHIMNDEATRKYLQAIKRLLTFMQRAHPTEPSRCVDFDAHRDAGRGGAGAGSDKQALLEAANKGEDWKALGLQAAPHYVESDGSIKVPEKWENIVKRSEAYKVQQQQSKTPPRTPPRS